MRANLTRKYLNRLGFKQLCIPFSLSLSLRLSNQASVTLFLKLLSPKLPLGCGCWVTGILAPTLTGNDLNGIQKSPLSTCKHIRAL